MMKPEVAKQQLAAWRVAPGDGDDETHRLLPGLKRLPAKLRGVGFLLLELNAQGEDVWGDWNQLHVFHEEQTRVLERLSANDRRKLFRLFFGELADFIEVAWQWMKLAPYAPGYPPMPFRAPRSPELTLNNRVNWVRGMVRLAAAFRADVLTPAWLAAWAPHLQVGWRTFESEIATLLAAVIDGEVQQADEVFEILCQSARKEHDIGSMGQHVIRALLSASRPEGWELMEKMLLAARRQEGLRQAILECVIEAHPQALQRMLRLIAEEQLARFSSVVQAVDSWFGMAWAAAGGKQVHDTIETVAGLLESAPQRKNALAGDDAERAYLSLWATACEDASASVKPAEKLLGHDDVELRYVAALHLSRLGFPAAQPARIKALDDEDLRVALAALSGPTYEEDSDSDELESSAALFSALERLFERMPQRPKRLPPLVWPWTEQETRREHVGRQLVYSLGDLPPTRLIPHLKQLDPTCRAQVASALGDQKKWDDLTRATILDLAGDASEDVRSDAFRALKRFPLKPADAELLEGYLTRTAADLRNNVVSLLLSMSDKQVQTSADRLLSAKHKNQRLAGLEVLRQLAEADRQREKCIAAAVTWAESRKKLLKEEQSQLDAIVSSGREVLSLDNALGLMDPAKRSKPVAPKKRKVTCVTAATTKILTSLDAVVHEHRHETIYAKDLRLGEIEYGFPSPNYGKAATQQVADWPLGPVWEDWYRKRPATLKDRDGLELLRAGLFLYIRDDWIEADLQRWLKGAARRKLIGTLLLGTAKMPKLKHKGLLPDLIDWLLFMHPPDGGVDFLLDLSETIHALIPAGDVTALKRQPSGNHSSDDGSGSVDEESDWRSIDAFSFPRFFGPLPKLTKKQTARQWPLLRWMDEPIDGALRQRPKLDDLIQAYHVGSATLDDVTDHLLGPRERYGWGSEFDGLSTITGRQLDAAQREFAARPEIVALIERCSQRLLEIELARGEAPTVATDAALCVGTYRGTDTVMKLLIALGKDGFKKARGWRAEARDSRRCTFTELVEKTFPGENDTPAAFSKAVKQAIAEGHFPQERLLQLAFLAPQWTDHVEATLGWDGFAEGLYWFMAHMKYIWGIDDAFEEVEELDEDDSTEEGEDQPQRLSRWERMIRERTPLTAEERANGAIDVAWFHRTYQRLTPKRWEAMAAAARFAASAAGAKRAQYIGDVLLGKASNKELVDGIRKKNLKENVRLLGLLPLAGGAKRDAEIAQRYETLQEYRRYANKLSSMTKPEALLACDIGMTNLAATAGYVDPMRLQWALEAESTKDLAKGPVAVSKGDVSLTLSLNEDAQPELTIRRDDKQLKSLPKAVNKEKKFVELRERSTQLKRQASRVKQSLEIAMCRGDTFAGGELWQLADHAILWPQLQRLVLVGEGILGYPVKRGKALADPAGKLEPVKKKEQLRIAHPYDLLRSKGWDKWQRECFAAERLQPFKQVFRELYVVTRQEKKDKTFSNRYAGQQVNPRQARALWGSRGWSADEYGDVWKTFHDEAVTVSVSFEYGVTTPLEVEGLTIDQVRFCRSEEHEPLKLTDVPPRIFSEAMRDMDLVVSVAHAGEVDPEASASTVEMRENLLRETCQLLRLKNVRLRDSRAVIRGQLGEYTVHLGSGVVHRLPGGSVCIVPVHSQHRGRLFLPFADDDPRTAEVVSKTLLLARDDEIDDPIILEQLRAMA